MTKQLSELYRQCRKNKPFMLVGSDAKCSLDAARTILAFRQAESDGLVRLRAEEEQESYLDVYGKPDDERELAALIQTLELHGVWCSISEWFDGNEWRLADSCGMHAGYKNVLDPFENCYIVQEMQEALDQLAAYQEAVCIP